MDHHLKFRMDSLKQASSVLGKPTPSRLPVSSSPMLFRPNCKPVPLQSQSQEQPAQPDPTEEASARRVRSAQERCAKDSPQIREQVKQLQFWLKVFSRFCQDDNSSR
jgi:hypothetical protein